MKKVKSLVVALIASLLLIGCGGVDKNRLAELTGDKSFEQIKKDYMLSVANEKVEDEEVYAYLLNKYADSDAAFDFGAFKQKIEIEWKKEVESYKANMQMVDNAIKNKTIDRKKLKELKAHKETFAMFSYSNKFIKNEYVPFLEDAIQRADAIIKQNELDEQSKFMPSFLKPLTTRGGTR